MISESEIQGVDYYDLAPNIQSIEDENPFSTMMSSFDEAADKLGLDPDLYAILRKPDREVQISVPVRLDDGTLTVFEGFRVQHNSGLGPYFGPLRVQAGIKMDDLRALAAWMTWKCSVLNIPFGGSAGGVRMAPSRHSRGEVERAVRRYVSGLMQDIGPDRDIFSSDVATDENIMAWVMDTVSMHTRYTENAVVCGKPMTLCGSYGHVDSVAQGMRMVLGPAMDFTGLPRKGARIIIQGSGVRGGSLARMLSEEGYKIVALSDLHGAFYNERGLDVPALLQHRAETGSLRGAKGSFDRITNEQMLVRDCDVLIPCAVAGTIHLRLARDIKAKLIVEGAHGAISSRAERVLAERSVRIVPDILATGGGAVVNYFEWVQNRAGYSWSAPTVQERLQRFMSDAWKEVETLAKEQNVRLRMAAHMLAVRRVGKADSLRGVYA
ncbi:MAG: Glu/Leu/Phe/Val dehydrogenase [Planctomycetes bacterium]|nr:Glu/Leu/Phe/Val dehydrogenase [Planctomycetota bacterium]